MKNILRKAVVLALATTFAAGLAIAVVPKTAQAEEESVILDSDAEVTILGEETSRYDETVPAEDVEVIGEETSRYDETVPADEVTVVGEATSRYDSNGLPTWSIIIIVVGGVVLVGAVIALIIKKKK